jgi:hypothetical protein
MWWYHFYSRDFREKGGLDVKVMALRYASLTVVRHLKGKV